MPYQSDGGSGVTRYAIGPDYIVLEFKSGEAYLYNHSTPGRSEVETMKRLAEAGKGLTTFINRKVGASYAEKLW
jgi:hypothetical protein